MDERNGSSASIGRLQVKSCICPYEGYWWVSYILSCPLNLIPISPTKYPSCALCRQQKSCSCRWCPLRTVVVVTLSVLLCCRSSLQLSGLQTNCVGRKVAWIHCHYFFYFFCIWNVQGKALGPEQFGGTFDLGGEIWLYISHWPCISCLAVLCQVLALAPAAPRLITPWTSFDHIIF